jgi:SAM-dependent methyltransferase
MHNQFDLVLNFGVIYHLLNPMIALEKTFQATKPGGMAIIETGYDAGDIIWGASSSWSLWRNFDGDSGNFFFPTIEGLKNALEICGFVDCRHSILVPPPFLGAKVKRHFWFDRCIIIIEDLPELTPATERLVRPGRCVMTARKP